MCAPAWVPKRATTPIARPRWTLLYGIAAFGLAALAVTEIAAAAPLRPALETAVGGAAVVAVALWLRGNRAALEQQEWCACAADTLTVRVIPSRRPAPIRVTPPRVPDVRPVEDDEDAAVVLASF